MRLIVNADDLGISEAVNDATFGLIEKGLVSSASIIANAPAVESIVARCEAYPNVSFGVHLNLTQFAPLTGNRGLQPLLGGNGCFNAKAIRREALGPSLLKAVWLEWKGQISRLRDYGLSPSHIDSHHHVHTIPALLPVLKAVQISCGIRRVRTTKNIYSELPGNSHKMLAQKRVWHFILRHFWPTDVTDGFTSLDDLHHVLERDALSQWLGDDRDVCIEVMVHPGNPNYAAETAKLSSAWMSRHAIRLVSYHRL